MPVTMRLTAPIQSSEDTWLCYLDICGLDCGYCLAIQQVSPFYAVLSAAEALHRIVRPHEEFLKTDESIGYCGFPRVLSVLTSDEAMKEIDAMLEKHEPRKIKWLKRRK